MDLDRAMLQVAQHLEAPEADLTDRVRSAMLEALNGVGAPDLRAWLRTEYGGTSDPAGALYQAMLGRVITRGANGELEVRRERKAHRATGAYYTQDAVVRYMLARAGEFLPGLSTVVDPACGSGVFLAGARAAFPEREVRLTGLDADPHALALCRQNVPTAALYTVDSLLDQTPEGFDLCIGNPPYISSGLRGAVSHDAERQHKLRQRYPRTAQYKLNTYPLFVERGLELVREGGVLGYILPDSFLSGRYFEGLRRLLLEHTLLELTLVCQDFWEHGRVGQSVILFVRRGPAPSDHQVVVRVCQTVADLDTAPVEAVGLSDLVWGALHRFRLIPSPSGRLFVRALEDVPGSRPLGEFLRTYSGLIGKTGQESLLRSANPALPGPWGRLLRSGREIDRYWLEWAGEEVCLAPDLIKSGGRLDYYRNPKLLLRQTADSLRGVYDDQGFFCLNNIHLLVPRQGDVPLRALLGLINSEPVDRYYRAMTMETGRLYPQVDLDLLEAIPVPPLGEFAVKALERLVRQRESAASHEAAQIEQAMNYWVEQAYGLR